MIVYVVLKYKGEEVKGVEVTKTLEQAGKIREQQPHYKCVIKRKIVR
jgi:hypothetical protein